GNLAFSGRLAERWKEWIDRRWMAMYRMPPMGGEPMRCGGCGAKLDAAALSSALASLKVPLRADIPAGLAAADDAAVTRPAPGMALVQSVDHFRAFLDDPFVFGQIAAAHALSDIHAMGAAPWTALAIAGLPHGPRMGEDLAAMMQGAVSVLERDGCALVGGHSAETAETSLGFAVTGQAPEPMLWRKSGLRPGEAIILTKPLGTGIILAAHMRGLARARWLQAALASMTVTNAAAARILRAHGVRACTDVTGFGLAGHLAEMLRASGCAAALNLAAIPALPGALELAAQGVESTLAPANRAVTSHALLADPQTSGGLLAGVAPECAEACLHALRAKGMDAAIIGRAIAGPAGLIETGGRGIVPALSAQDS
ncbi:MAG TPA: selenide, water dikinase SelD, partial [Acetobacteraceae bacterium]